MQKKLRLCFGVLCLLSLLLFTACERVETMQSLAAFSKPYAGEYRCETLLLGGKEYAEEYEVKLNLKNNGAFELTYRGKSGEQEKLKGSYEVIKEGKFITLSTGLKLVSRTFPMEDGAIVVDMLLAKKLLHAEFRMP